MGETKMKLTPTAVEFRFRDPGGYRFTVKCDDVKERDDEGNERSRGWTARVEMVTTGLRTPEAAVSHLRYAVEAFLEMLPKERP